jgi:hypothetical protein
VNCCNDYGQCTQGDNCAAWCCNQDCNQGRDCPARVAKVGRRTQDRDPLPPSQFRRYLPDLARAALYTLVVLFTAAIALTFLA